MLGQVMLKTVTRHIRVQRGFTLIELFVGVAILAIVVALGVPSLRSWMNAQRVASVAGELATDMRFARSEAISTNMEAGVSFKNAGKGCYTVYRAPPSRVDTCDCTQPAGLVCPHPLVELKTVVMPGSGDVTISTPAGMKEIYESGSKLVDGGAAEQITIAGSSTSRQLRVTTSSGLQHPTVCAPTGSTIPGFKACL